MRPTVAWFVTTYSLGPRKPVYFRADPCWIAFCYPSPVRERRITQISLGVEHSVALTETSDVYVWGSNSQGQLGLGYVSQAPVTTPTRIDCLAGLPVRQLVAGGYHNLLLTPSGSIYVWGSDSYGQLGLNDSNERMEVDEVPAGASRRVSRASCSSVSGVSGPLISVPTLIKNMRKLRVTYVACGESHSVLLTQNGQLLTFGSGRFGQLGHGNNKRSGPSLLSALSGREVLQVACGSNHTLVAVRSISDQETPGTAVPTAEVFAFGAGGEGQLGVGDLHRRFLPTPIPGNWMNQGIDGSNSFVVTELFAGGHHCFALVSKGTISLDYDQTLRELGSPSLLELLAVQIHLFTHKQPSP
ncbi:Probable E3 ubiquitin-protein ligase herc4 [Sparganum proliferum]